MIAGFCDFFFGIVLRFQDMLSMQRKGIPQISTSQNPSISNYFSSYTVLPI